MQCYVFSSQVDSNSACKQSQNIRKEVIESFLGPVNNSVEPIYGKLSCSETLLAEKKMKALEAVSMQVSNDFK